jgi:hypothetical protein
VALALLLQSLVPNASERPIEVETGLRSAAGGGIRRNIRWSKKVWRHRSFQATLGAVCK